MSAGPIRAATAQNSCRAPEISTQALKQISLHVGQRPLHRPAQALRDGRPWRDEAIADVGHLRAMLGDH